MGTSQLRSVCRNDGGGGRRGGGRGLRAAAGWSGAAARLVAPTSTSTSTVGDGAGGEQRGAEVGGAVVAVGGLAGHGRHTTSSSDLRHARPDLPRPQRIALEARQGDGRLAVALERRAAAEHLVEDDAEAVDVGARVDRLALDLLGREVLGRADHEARLGEVGALGRLGDAEVGDLHPAVAGEQHVGRLDVAVDEPGPVGGVERLGDLGGQPGRLPRVDRRRVVEALAQRAPGHQLHHDRLGAVLRAGVVDRDDARVGEAGGGDRLLAEPGDEAVVGGEVGVEQLHRDLAAQDLVGAAPHLGHAAGRDERRRGGSGPPSSRPVLRDARRGRRRAVGGGSGGRHGPTRLTPCLSGGPRLGAGARDQRRRRPR